jgi:hypothetical protein
MPVLPLEPYVYPDDLLELPPPSPDSDSERWWVVHTKPRTEKCLARWLRLNRIPYYLPLYARRFYHRTKLVTSYLPLFPSYVFLRGDSDARLAVFRTGYAVQTINPLDQVQLQNDLQRVRIMLDSGVSVTPEERIQPGQWVEIRSGPLKGLQGKVVRVGPNLRFLVEIDFLRRGASCEVDGWQLRVIDGPSQLTPAGTSSSGVSRRRRRRRRRRGGSCPPTPCGFVM